MAVSLSGMTLYTNNDNEGGWDATTDGPDAYNESVQGTNSESWQIRKNENLTALLTKSASLPTSRGIFIVWLKSDVKNFYNNVDIILRSSTNNEKSFAIADSTTQYCDGLWRPFALDYINNGTPTGTFAPASLTVMGWHLSAQNVNFRAIINNWCDACYYGVGHSISGTTTTDLLFKEAAAVDQTVSNQYGVLENYNGVIYSQGDLDLTGTSLVSIGETLVFKDTPNGYSTYNLDVSGTASFTNTSIFAAGTIDYNFDTSGATSFSMSGGALEGYLSLVTASGQTMSGIVFQSGGTATVANTISDSSFNQCGLITVTGVLDGCTINQSTATSAVSTTTLAKLTDCTFISDGTGHAVNLGTISSTQSMTWSCTDSGYAGTNGSTGNETILVNVASGQTLTINVGTGATTPTYYNTGSGTVTVISGAVTVRVTAATVNGTKIAGARIYLKKVVGGAVILNGISDANGVVEDTAYTYTSDEDVTGWIRKSTSSPLYKQAPLSGTITSTGFATTGVLILDE
jgi:hypothetical protein